MRMSEITARLREPLWGCDEPHKSMWLDTAKFVLNNKTTKLASFRQTSPQNHANDAIIANALHSGLLPASSHRQDWLTSHRHVFSAYTSHSPRGSTSGSRRVVTMYKLAHGFATLPENSALSDSVYTIQPVVKPVEQPVVSCKRGIRAIERANW